MPSRAIPRWLGPWILVAAGAIWTLFLQATVQPGVYFSGDGGLKAQVVEQFAAGHWTPKLVLDAEPWVRDLWEEGFYPFGPPFVWERGGDRIVAFPLPFLVLSTPPFQSFGYRGLYLLPLLATWAVWIRFLFLGRGLRLSGLALGLGLFALIFASHLTLYSAMFWEHNLAVALAPGRSAGWTRSDHRRTPAGGGAAPAAGREPSWVDRTRDRRRHRPARLRNLQPCSLRHARRIARGGRVGGRESRHACPGSESMRSLP